MGKSIKFKIISSLIATIFLLGVIVSTWVVLYSSKSYLEHRKEELAMTTVEAASKVNSVLHETQELVYTIAGSTRMQEYFELRNREKLTGFLMESNSKSLDKALLVFDREGVIYASTDKEYIGKNLREKSYFQKSIQGEFGVDMIFDALTNEPEFIFSYPLKDKNDQVIGVIAAVLEISTTHDTLIVSGNMEDHKHMLVDNYGIILDSNLDSILYRSLGRLSEDQMAEIEDKNYLQNFKIEPLTYDQVSDNLNEIGTIKVFDLFDRLENEEEVVTVSRIGDLPYYIVMEAMTEHFEHEMSGVYYMLGLGVFSSAILSSLLVYFLLNRFLNPLKLLISAAKEITRDNYNTRVVVKGNDELSELAMAFNDMAQKVQGSIVDIEKRVKIQTKDILNKQNQLENQKLAVLNILEDIAEEKEKASTLAKDLKKFQLAIDNSSDSIVITDTEGIVLYVNGAASIISGFSQKEILGKKAGKLWGKHMSVQYYRGLWNTVKINKKPYIGEIYNKRKNGESYVVASQIIPILDEEGNVEFFVGIERDVTKQKEVDKAKTEFVSLASHQLKTPLSAIKWNIEMILNGDLGKVNQDQHEFLKQIQESNERMIDLVNALLNVSRIDMGTFIVEPDEIYVQDICESVIQELTPVIKEKKQVVQQQYIGKKIKISADAKLLRIVIQNLISNAVKYTPSKGKIIISIIREKGGMIFSVKDTGFGIPRRQQDKIFSKLFRADNAKEQVADGNGLGLYIAKAIIEQSGGKIWFDSVENKGTTFSFSLPPSGMKSKSGAKELS